MKCTHKCNSCKAKIKDNNGFDICTYFGSIKKHIHWDISNFSATALNYSTRNHLYFYDDGLYLYDPLTCCQLKSNYKLIKENEWTWKNGEKGYRFAFEYKDETWFKEKVKINQAF